MAHSRSCWVLTHLVLAMTMVLGAQGNSLSASSVVRWTPPLRRGPKAGVQFMVAAKGVEGGIGAAEEAKRMLKSKRYEELFSKMVPSDLRKLGVQQIADGEKPWFEKHNEKVALYDKLFSKGTDSGLELVEGADKIKTGKLRELSDIEGPDGVVRMGVSFDSLFD